MWDRPAAKSAALSDAEVLRLRARAQRLSAEARKSTAPAVLIDVCGLQAQVLTAAWLGVRARSPGIQMTDLDRALNAQRSIVRSWLMRGTLHVVAAEDFRWLLQLLGPVFVRASATRHAQLGLDDTVKSRGIVAIRQILTDAGPLTRSELVDRLRERGITLDRETQAPIHLIGLAALHGILCLGPDRDGKSTYVLLDDWVGRAPALPRDRALAELARRYFAAYGPARAEDLAAWSGLPMAEARAAVSGAKASLAAVTIQRQPGFVLKGRPEQAVVRANPKVRLLPAFDSYLLGYQRRDLAVPRPLQRRLQRGGGWLHPAVVINGRAVGAWSLRRTGHRGRVTIEPFEALTKAVRAQVDHEVADISRFLGISVESEIRGRLTADP